MNEWKRLNALLDTARHAMSCRCGATREEYCECDAGPGLSALDALERELRQRVPDESSDVSVEKEVAF